MLEGVGGNGVGRRDGLLAGKSRPFRVPRYGLTPRVVLRSDWDERTDE